MPIHDWTRVPAGACHAFHLSWISEIQEAFNGGLLPHSYYAQAEQVIGPMGPDVLTLQESDPSDLDTDFYGTTDFSSSPADAGGGVATASLAMRYHELVEMNAYVPKRRLLTIRHTSGDRIVALLEIVSPGNKASQYAIDTFVKKATECVERGYHVSIIDLFPIGPRDPHGIHSLIWKHFSPTAIELPAGEPLSLVAYNAGPSKEAYLEPTAIGHALVDLPLFLRTNFHVNVPLEATYLSAYRGVPQRWKNVLELPETTE